MKAFFGKKKIQYYNGLLIKADLGLHEQIAEKIRLLVPIGAKILDMGAGEGALSARLSDMGYQVTAADKDRSSFKCKQSCFSCINFDVADELEKFVLRNENEFDAVLGIEVIEHVHDQWQYLLQLMRLAKKGGVILVTTPNTTSWLSRLIFFFTGRFHQFADSDLSYGHINPITPWELELILRESGADQIRISPAGTLPPIYLAGINRWAIFNVVCLVLRPFMRGILDGWCVIATARRPA